MIAINRSRCTIPDALEKAIQDRYWLYILETTRGDQLMFAGARHDGDGWLHLFPAVMDGDTRCGVQRPDARRVSGRGIDIHVTSIAWVADADG